MHSLFMKLTLNIVITFMAVLPLPPHFLITVSRTARILLIPHSWHVGDNAFMKSVLFWIFLKLLTLPPISFLSISAFGGMTPSSIAEVICDTSLKWSILKSMKQMKKRSRCNECRLITPFPLNDATSIYGSDIVLSARVQLQISPRTQVSSTPTSSPTKQPATSCLPPDSTMPGALMSTSTMATAAAAAAAAWRPLKTTAAAAPSPGAVPTPPPTLPGRPLARAAQVSIMPGTRTPVAAVAAPRGRGQLTRLAPTVIGKRSSKFQPKKDLITL